MNNGETHEPAVTKGGVHWLARLAAESQVGGETPNVDARTLTPSAWSLVAASLALTDDALVELVASRYKIPVANLALADRRALRLVPERIARRYVVLPLRDDNVSLVVASCDPHNLEIEQVLTFASGRRLAYEIAPPRAIQDAIDATYSPNRSIEALLAHVQSDIADSVRVVESRGPQALSAVEAEAAPVVKLTSLILFDATRQGASDVHLEPDQDGAVVRFRVDGVLRTYMRLPIEALNRVVSRVKIMGNIDIADRLRPHDGRARVQVERRVFDLRLSTVPTRDSEKAVIRLLDPLAVGGLNDLALPEPTLNRLKRLLARRDGIVLVTGPTGSGKTTTIYAGIRELSTGEVNIMSVEDPTWLKSTGALLAQEVPATA